jgi:SAM-dependent methyltransferase
MAGLLATVGTGIPLVVDLRDPWSNQSGPWRHHPVYGAATARTIIPLLEGLVFRRAAEVIVNTRELADALDELHPGLGVSFLRNGVDVEQLPREPAAPLPRLSVAYAGTLYGDRVADPVLNGFRLFLERYPEARASSRFRIAGHWDSDRGLHLAGRVRAHGLESQVELLGVVPRSRALEMVSGSQVAVVLAQNQGLQVPAKLYESLAMGVPTLMIAEGESAAGREGRRLGAVVKEPADIEGICSVLEDAWRGSLGRRQEALGPIDYAQLTESLNVLLTAEIGLSKLARAPRLPARPAREFALQGEPRANWMWLADPPGWKRALELSMGSPVMARALGLRFADVVTLDCTAAADPAPAGGGASGGGRFRLPYESESFDCVTMHGVWHDLTRLAAAGDVEPEIGVLGECRRVLRPGGCLLVTAYNPRYRRLFAAMAADRPAHFPAVVRAMGRKFRSTGFSRWQAYYVTPSHNVPKNIIPVARSAVLRYERFTEGHTLRGLARRALGMAGLHQVLYQSVAYLVYR